MRITVLAGGIGAARFLRGLLAAAPRRDDHRHRQHRRRHHPVRPAGLPGPGLGDVHARRRQQRGAGLGARGRDASHRRTSSPPTARSRPGSRSATSTSPRTSSAASCSPGQPLSEVTRVLCERWQPGVRLLPMSDDRVETRVKVGGELIHFQEWWVRLHAAVPAEAITPVGADGAAPAPGVLEAIADADFVLFPPSNPVVSIGPILAVPGIRAAVAAKTVVGRFRDHRRRPGPRHGRRLPDRDRRGDLRRRRRRALRPRPDQRLAGRRAGQGRGRRPGAGRHRGPRPAPVHARRPVVGRDRPGRHRPREGTHSHDEGTVRRGVGRPGGTGRGSGARSQIYGIAGIPGDFPRRRPGRADRRRGGRSRRPRAARRRHPRGHLEGGQQGRGPGGHHDPRGRDRGGDRARGGQARADDDRADQARVRDGRRRGGRVQHRARHRRAAA